MTLRLQHAQGVERQKPALLGEEIKAGGEDLRADHIHWRTSELLHGGRGGDERNNGTQKVLWLPPPPVQRADLAVHPDRPSTRAPAPSRRDCSLLISASASYSSAPSPMAHAGPQRSSGACGACDGAREIQEEHVVNMSNFFDVNFESCCMGVLLGRPSS